MADDFFSGLLPACSGGVSCAGAENSVRALFSGAVGPVIREIQCGCAGSDDFTDAIMELTTQSQETIILRALMSFSEKLDALEKRLAEIHKIVSHQSFEKEWYTTNEVAEALGKAEFTVREKWCNQGRIEADKNPDNGKWRIPGEEFRRLKNGGSLKPPKG